MELLNAYWIMAVFLKISRYQNIPFSPHHDVATIAMRFHNMTMGLDWTLDTGEWTNYCNAKLSTPNHTTHAVTFYRIV